MTTPTDTTTADHPSTDEQAVFTITRHECADCGSAFAAPAAVVEHRWDAHVDHDAVPIAVVCDKCDAMFDTRAALDDHHETDHLPAFPLECTRCHQPFDTESDAIEHFWRTHTGETGLVAYAVRCPLCEKVAPAGSTPLLDHCTTQHDIDAVFAESYGTTVSDTCPECGATLADEHGMLQHFAAKHSLDAAEFHRCTICDDSFDDHASAIEHVRRAHAPDVEGVDEATRACPDCSTTNQRESSLETHYLRRHLDGHLECPDCEERGSLSAETELKHHHWLAHEDGSETGIVTQTAATVDRDETLECLYNINKHAKKYANLATENYRKGKKTSAKANSHKKNALYAIKDTVIEQIYDDAAAIRLHTIDGNEFYHVDFDTFSFHSPVETVSLPGAAIDSTDTLDDFKSSMEKEHSDKSLKECLLFFEDAFGLNANEFLDQQYLSWGPDSHFIGWPYLGDS